MIALSPGHVNVTLALALFLLMITNQYRLEGDTTPLPSMTILLLVVLPVMASHPMYRMTSLMMRMKLITKLDMGIKLFGGLNNIISIKLMLLTSRRRRRLPLVVALCTLHRATIMLGMSMRDTKFG